MVVLKMAVIMLYDSLNFRQATWQELLKVTCTGTHFQSFSLLISRIVHPTVLVLGPCLKSLPALMCIIIAIWCTCCCPYLRYSNPLDFIRECWLVMCQDWWAGCVTAQKLDCVTVAMCQCIFIGCRARLQQWCILLLHQQHVWLILPVHFTLQFNGNEVTTEFWCHNKDVTNLH